MTRCVSVSQCSAARVCGPQRRTLALTKCPALQALVRESERRRYADPTQVDRVIALDQAWRDGAHKGRASSAAAPVLVWPLRHLTLDACMSARYALDNLNKEYNALNKAVAKLKIVRRRCPQVEAPHQERGD